jgi:hypothetical protein
VDHLPLDSYITESFAKASVSKVGYRNLLNWVRYAKDLWARKKSPHKVNAYIIINMSNSQ